jgi:AraC-like DNA-binding protein
MSESEAKTANQIAADDASFYLWCWARHRGWPLDTIAARCGFGSTETMRRAFKRVISIGPGEYRDRFRWAELTMP